MDRFDQSGLIVPMAHDVNVRCLRIDPTVPHDTMGIKGVFRDTHRVCHAATTIVFHTTIVCIRVREDDFHTAGADPFARPGTLTPVVVPTEDLFDGESILIMIVSRGIYVLFQCVSRCRMEGTIAISLPVIRIGIFVPILPQPLVTAILHRPHRVMLALVYIQHLTAIFSLADVKHLARTDGTSAMRVVPVAQGLHLQHVLTADGLIATLVEKDARIVAVIDDGVAHQLHALLPLTSFAVFLGVAFVGGLLGGRTALSDPGLLHTDRLAFVDLTSVAKSGFPDAEGFPEAFRAVLNKISEERGLVLVAKNFLLTGPAPETRDRDLTVEVITGLIDRLGMPGERGMRVPTWDLPKEVERVLMPSSTEAANERVGKSGAFDDPVARGRGTDALGVPYLKPLPEDASRTLFATEHAARASRLSALEAEKSAREATRAAEDLRREIERRKADRTFRDTAQERLEAP